MRSRMRRAANGLTRRQFLQVSAAAASAWALAACQPGTPSALAPTETVPPTQALPSSTSAPSATPTPTHTLAPTATLAPSATSTPTATPNPYLAAVAFRRAADYAPAALRQALAEMLEGLGGLAGLLPKGARVGLKPNLTGGAWWDAPNKPPATEYFATHPALVRALAELLVDAGATQITIMDGLGDGRIYDLWGYTAIAHDLNARLVDLCLPDPYPSFVPVPVPGAALVYDRFYLNPALQELDVFISIGKMKCHATTGVTLSLKNLFGIAPISEYRLKESHNNRSAFHGEASYDRRVPQVIVDLNRARPIHLALIDGVMTAEGGAGPWDAGLSQVKPGLLALGKDPLAVDAVSTALMGFDPPAAGGAHPFFHGDNHLLLAEQAGLGTCRLEKIDLLGQKIADFSFPFKPVL